MSLREPADGGDAPVRLTGITWDHSRGFVPMVATAQRFHERHPSVEVTWHKRTLQEFADQPIAELAARFDLLVIDHPWAGFAASSRVLAALDDLLDPRLLEDLEANTVGSSHLSYQYKGHQWALPIDAACPVSARRHDLLEAAGLAPPATFDELLALGRRGLICCPSIPLDVYGNFLNLCRLEPVELFDDPEELVARDAGIAALDRLLQLSNLVPEEFFTLNPIATLEVMATTDRFAYCPYTYGYINYSRPGYGGSPLRFGDVIGLTPEEPGATMLGGTGLAISASCSAPEVAAAYASFVADPATQCGLYFDAGGQPGHLSAWHDPTLDAVSLGFFSATLPTLQRAFVRPRHAGYLAFQDAAGNVIHAYLREGGSAAATLDTVNRIYRESGA